MIDQSLKTQVNRLLVGLVILDIVLFTFCLFFPDLWFKIFHDLPYADPAGLLRRTGGVWVAFTLFQLVALFRWQKEPYWLVLVAGIRLTELFSDWIYLGVAYQVTWFAKLGLFISPPANALMGWFLIRSYLKIRSKE